MSGPSYFVACPSVESERMIRFSNEAPQIIEIPRESVVVDETNGDYSLRLIIREFDKPKTCVYGLDYSLSDNVPRRVDMRFYKVKSQISAVVHRLRGIWLSEGKFRMSTGYGQDQEIDECPYEGMSVSGPNDDRRTPVFWNSKGIGKIVVDPTDRKGWASPLYLPGRISI